MPDLSFTEVGEILQLLQGVEATDVELEWGDLRLHVRRGGQGTAPNSTSPDGGSPLSVSTAGAGEASAALSQSARPQPAQQQPIGTPANGGTREVPEHWVAVCAPMAGTFYRTPKPDEPPYAEVGDLVSEGDTVALVEVMKLFTELKAEASGKVARIDVTDGSMVEFGQALIWIEPA